MSCPILLLFLVGYNILKKQKRRKSQPKYDVGSEEVFPLNPDWAADLCAIIRIENNHTCFFCSLDI